MRDIIPINIASAIVTHTQKNGSNPTVNALSINPSEQIHETYSGARRSVIGKARIPIAIQASMSNNVQQNPGHAIHTPIISMDRRYCITPQTRANKATVTRSA